MTKDQNDQFNMLRLVELHFDDHASIWSSNDLVSDVKAALSDKIQEIMAMMVMQSKKSKGATEKKALLRADLEKKGLDLSSALGAYASRNPSSGLHAKKVNITKSAFVLFRESDLLLAIESLNAEATTVIEALWPYGVTQATLDELMVARTAFLEKVGVPEEIITARKEATQAIATLIGEAIWLLEGQMDKLVRAFAAAQPDFVHGYYNDRKIHRTGQRKLSLSITTLDAGTKAPLAKAEIEVEGHGIKRISNGNGKNKVQNLKEGYYNLLVSRDGFVPQKIPFSIVHGKTTQLVVEMEEEVSEFLRR